MRQGSISFFLGAHFLFLPHCGLEPPKEIPENPYAEWALDSVWREGQNPTTQNASFLRGLQILNALDQIEGTIEWAKPDPGLQLSSWKEKLPSSLSQILDNSLEGIYFVRGLGSTGVSVLLRDNQGIPKRGLIFLDVDYLKKPINSWGTDKEKSAFRLQDGEDLRLQMTENKDDTIQSTFEFIVFHELGHILSIQGKHAPDIAEKKRDFARYPFFDGVWWSEVDSAYDQTFLPERKKLKFYGNPSFSLYPEGFHYYKKLQNTPFLSLYASLNADDYFAESFAIYLHSRILGRPYQVVLYKDFAPHTEYQGRLLSESGRKPREFFQKLFGDF